MDVVDRGFDTVPVGADRGGPVEGLCTLETAIQFDPDAVQRRVFDEAGQDIRASGRGCGLGWRVVAEQVNAPPPHRKPQPRRNEQTSVAAWPACGRLDTGAPSIQPVARAPGCVHFSRHGRLGPLGRTDDLPARHPPPAGDALHHCDFRGQRRPHRPQDHPRAVSPAWQ